MDNSKNVIKRLFTWDFFMGILFGIFICTILSFLLYMKSINNLIQDRERVKEKEAIVDKVLNYMNEIDMIKEWNEQAMIIEPEINKEVKHD